MHKENETTKGNKKQGYNNINSMNDLLAADPKVAAFYAKCDEHKRTQALYRAKIKNLLLQIRKRNMELFIKQFEELEQEQTHHEDTEFTSGLECQVPQYETDDNKTENNEINEFTEACSEEPSSNIDSGGINPLINKELVDEKSDNPNIAISSIETSPNTDNIQKVFNEYTELFQDEQTNSLEEETNTCNSMEYQIKIERPIQKDDNDSIDAEGKGRHENEINYKDNEEKEEIIKRTSELNDTKPEIENNQKNNILINEYRLYDNNELDNVYIEQENALEDEDEYDLSSSSSQDSLVKLLNQRDKHVLKLKDLYYNSRLLSVNNNIVEANKNKVSYAEERIAKNDKEELTKEEKKPQFKINSHKLNHLAEKINLFSNEAAQMYWDGFLMINKRSNKQ